MSTFRIYEVAFFAAKTHRHQKPFQPRFTIPERKLVSYGVAASSLFDAERKAWRTLKREFQKGKFQNTPFHLENVTKAETRRVSASEIFGKAALKAA